MVCLFWIISLLAVARRKFTKYQTEKAQRAIQTIRYKVRSMMTHLVLHWSVDNADSDSLLAFTVTCPVWIYNHLQNKIIGWVSSLEVFTKTQSNHRD